MADVRELFDVPPAPKLEVLGKLDSAKATPAELRGQEIFFGKGQCSACHAPPFYTDNTMDNLQVERFCKPEMINGMLAAAADGPIKTFPLRGIKDSPPVANRRMVRDGNSSNAAKQMASSHGGAADQGMRFVAHADSSRAVSATSHCG